jgi:hypothetical protein
MRYRKGSIVISSDGDIPMLRQIRNSRFVSHKQLFELLQRDSVLSARSTFNWRIERLLQSGHVERIGHLNFQGSPVYSITRDGLVELEGGGDFAISLHSKTKHLPHRAQVFHALELSAIRLALARKNLLVHWQSEVEISSANMVSATPYEKDYDALIDIWVGSDIRRFALEYERSLKSMKEYEKIRAAIEADRQVPCVLYLTAHSDLMLALLYQMTPTSKRLGFATAKTFREQLLGTSIATGANLPLMNLEEFLRYAHPLYIQAS